MPFRLDRRRTAMGLGALGVLASAPTNADTSNWNDAMQDPDGLNGFDFLHGLWKVRHRKLRARLADDTAWDEFDGDCECRPMRLGRGNFEDHMIGQPAGAYTASATRYFNERSRQWAIYWIDSRFNSVEPPVLGGFRDGVGTFLADDSLNGKPIKVRFIWSDTASSAPHWEQAFSPDGGASWETNWTMRFTRVA